MDIFKRMANALDSGMSTPEALRATDNTTENTLSDYAEGAWTPVISDGTNNATHDVQSGIYMALGHYVFITGRVSTTSLGSVTGALRIDGLPYNNHDAVGSSVSCGYGDGFSVTAGNYVTAYVPTGEDHILLFYWSASTGASPMTDTQWTADGELIFNGFYCTGMS